jgi:hypothetical protein
MTITSQAGEGAAQQRRGGTAGRWITLGLGVLVAAFWAVSVQTDPTIPAGVPECVADPLTAARPNRIGRTTVLTGERRGRPGRRLAVTVDSVCDPAGAGDGVGQSDGRWVLVEWVISNVGTERFPVDQSAFKVRTADDALIASDPAPSFGDPRLDFGPLDPGQAERRFFAYRVPGGERLKAAVFQPDPSQSIVIADLTP